MSAALIKIFPYRAWCPTIWAANTFSSSAKERLKVSLDPEDADCRGKSITVWMASDSVFQLHTKTIFLFPIQSNWIAAVSVSWFLPLKSEWVFPALLTKEIFLLSKFHLCFLTVYALMTDIHINRFSSCRRPILIHSRSQHCPGKRTFHHSFH